VEAGNLVWIDVNHPHVHWADPDDPWEVYWLRAEGIQMNAAREILGVHSCFCVSPEEEPQTTFVRIFQLFQTGRQPFDALANAEVARLIALFTGTVRLDAENDATTTEIAGVLERMRISYQRPWTVEEIARHCGKSPAQTHRLFQRATGSSPIALLRRLRLEHAMERLVSTEDSVAEIAYQVGYNDPLFFSRDFKKTVGRSPTEYRTHER
jgi:AraC-like DNA-binding protein